MTNVFLAGAAARPCGRGGVASPCKGGRAIATGPSGRGARFCAVAFISTSITKATTVRRRVNAEIEDAAASTTGPIVRVRRASVGPVRGPASRATVAPTAFTGPAIAAAASTFVTKACLTTALVTRAPTRAQGALRGVGFRPIGAGSVLGPANPGVGPEGMAWCGAPATGTRVEPAASTGLAGRVRAPAGGLVQAPRDGVVIPPLSPTRVATTARARRTRVCGVRFQSPTD